MTDAMIAQGRVTIVSDEITASNNERAKIHQVRLSLLASAQQYGKSPLFAVDNSTNISAMPWLTASK